MSVSEEAGYESYDVLQTLLSRREITVTTSNPWKNRYSPSEFNKFLNEFLNKYCNFADYQRVNHVGEHIDREFMLYSCRYNDIKFGVVVTRDWEYGQRRAVYKNGGLTVEEEPRNVVKISVSMNRDFHTAESEYNKRLLRDALGALSEYDYELALAEYKLQHA